MDQVPLITKDGTLNLDLTIAILGFFKFNILEPGSVFGRFYDMLDDEKKVQPWRMPLEDGLKTLRKRWVGMYAFQRDAKMIELVRQYPRKPKTKGKAPPEYPDMFPDGKMRSARSQYRGFATMYLDFSPNKQWEWPGEFLYRPPSPTPSLY